MTVPARRIARGIALTLLLVAAVDLSFPSQCEDEEPSPRAQATLSTDASEAGPTHSGDDCFCCSRTVRIVTAVSVPVPSPLHLPVVGVPPEPLSADGRLLYHPPIL